MVSPRFESDHSSSPSHAPLNRGCAVRSFLPREPRSADSVSADRRRVDAGRGAEAKGATTISQSPRYRRDPKGGRGWRQLGGNSRLIRARTFRVRSEPAKPRRRTDRPLLHSSRRSRDADGGFLGNAGRACGGSDRSCLPTVAHWRRGPSVHQMRPSLGIRRTSFGSVRGGQGSLSRPVEHPVALLDRYKSIRQVDSVEPEFNLLRPAAIRDVVPWCREHGAGPRS